MRARTSMLGRAVGWVVAPLFGLVSFARRARTFHPRGPVYRGSVAVHPAAPSDLHPLAERLAGRALVRFSGALWKHAEGLPDVLGCAIRFRRDVDDTPEPAQTDQDLLFATIKRPWTMPFSPLTTNVRDYLANDYFAVSPFDVAPISRLYFRLRPTVGGDARSDGDGSRAAKLAHDVARGKASLTLSASGGPFGEWTPLVVVTLERASEVDGEALRFRPFRTGRGVRPRGFVHALRVGVYALSQRARPKRGRSHSTRRPKIVPAGLQ